MEEAKRIRLIHKQELEHVPDLLHRIQSLLDLKDAARTCVLSKSWLHAWSTIPNLRFDQSVMFASRERDYLELVERTILRYIRDDIPFEEIDLSIDIENHELASFAEKWLSLITTKSCLKKLCLSMRYIDSFTLPGDEIFSNNKLYKMSISGRKTTNLMMKGYKPGEKFLLINRNPVINCVLRVLELRDVTISDQRGLKNIKVRNLRYLCELKIIECKQGKIVEIHDVPNIRSFTYSVSSQRNPVTLNLDSLRCVTELSLDGLDMDDDSFLDLLKSEFHSLERLTLGIKFWWNSKSLDITCPPLKKLHITRSCSFIKVYAPKLHFFHYEGRGTPSLVFPAIVPAKIKLEILLKPSEHLFLVNIAEALKLSSEFDIKITTERFDLVEPSKIVMDELRTRSAIPATNVKHLSVQTYSDNDFWEWEHSPFFDAFFSICHPKHVDAFRDTRYNYSHYFCKLMLKEVLKKNTRKGFWPDYLKEVEIKNYRTGGNWETFNNSWKNCLPIPSLFGDKVEFKLNWLELVNVL